MLGCGFGTYEVQSKPPALSDLPWVRTCNHSPLDSILNKIIQGYLHLMVRLFLFPVYKPDEPLWEKNLQRK